MNQSISFLTLVCLLTLNACKHEQPKVATVIKDCTGTYLRLNGKDYQVCNSEKVAPFAEGSRVTATFKQIKECHGAAQYPLCYMNHPCEGWIEVDKIQ